ncbi:ABC transporter permease [Parvibium lacunae]|uniref:ABC transporter permease n=1 Tax=Parvibium lacunae TaxID=1888893 RepID=A0A368L575_9BURK|nr:FtsX-like permease family protein [Parvibium lacunae]RCS58300.1 ABC transporter permease [Parvibium lacunae]
MAMMHSFNLALRMLWRDWRAGELTLLLSAVVVAMAALSSVGLLTDRLQRGLARDATQLVGADLVISGDRPLNPDWAIQAQAAHLRSLQSVGFPSMAQVPGPDTENASGTSYPRSKLVSLFATEVGYPLRGQLKVADGSTERLIDPSKEPIQRGEVWVDAVLLRSLNLAVGQSLQLGEQQFLIRHEIRYEGPRGAGFANFAPRVLMRFEDLPKTGLLQLGSRATWRLWLAHQDSNESQGHLLALKQQIERALERGQRLETLENGRPEMRNALERAEQFLGLVATLAALLAALAIALGAQRFMQRHWDACAVMRCLGLSQQALAQILLLEFATIGCLGGGLGSMLGWGIQAALVSLTATLWQTSLPAPSLWPFVQAWLGGALLLLGFALPALLRLWQISPLAVLRRALPNRSARVGLAWLIAILLASGLVWSYAGQLKLAGIVLGAFLGGLGLFALVGLFVMQLIRYISARRLSGQPALSAFQRALNSIARRRQETALQIAALGMGLLALLLLGMTRTDLLDAWRAATPTDAPNRFVINLQNDQLDAFSAALRELGQRQQVNLAAPRYNPMIRGRLVTLNQQPILPEDYRSERAQRLVDREFNLSYSATLPQHNQLVAGKWFDPSAPQAELSIETGIAQTLGLKLGDTLGFDIAGTVVEARITSIRKLRWDSMQVNFFVIMPPHLLAEQPQSHLSAFYVPAPLANAVDNLVQLFPNITLIDTGAIARQVEEVLRKVTQAVELLFLFALAAGVLVLYAALLSSRDQRLQEVALLRTLGARQRHLQVEQYWEQAITGGLAGLIAATLAQGAGWALAHVVFEFAWQFKPWVWLIGGAGGALCGIGAGWLALRGIVSTPPLLTLRTMN